MAPSESRLVGQNLSVNYGGAPIVKNLSIAIPPEKITAIIGPNGCGKSTLLRALARVLKPSGGQVLLDGTDINGMRTQDVARKLGLLPQGNLVPPGITVEDLVARGRFAHGSWLRQWSSADAKACTEAHELTDTLDLRDRPVDTLSGGQRQRVWIALAIAQETPIMLLDEPTTFLDINHRLDVMDLLARLNREAGRTIVMVLHEISDACRYADRIIAMKDGAILTQGTASEVVTPSTMRDLFTLDCDVIPDPATGTPLVIPSARRSSGALAGGEA